MLDKNAVEQQLVPLFSKYPDGAYDSQENKISIPFVLNAEYEGVWIIELCPLRIELTDGYPQNVPMVFDAANRVPRQYSHRYSNGALCVGVPSQILMECGGTIDLLRFVEGPVTSCLYSAFFQEKYGRMPFGERSHGSLGILEYFEEFFNVDAAVAVKMLAYAAAGNYRGSDACPCGSRKQLWHCHGELMSNLMQTVGKEVLLNEMNQLRSDIEWAYSIRKRQELVRESVSSSLLNLYRHH